MRISVIGSGYVGLVTGVCFAELGHQVICVDNNLEKIAMLRKGKIPIYEPGLEELLQRNVKKNRLTFSGEIAHAVKDSQIIFISVNTPPLPNGDADLSSIEFVSREIARHLTSYRLIVGKSTVPVQTGAWIYRTIKSIQQDETLFDVASNPEFLREGSAVHDFLNPDRVVIGVKTKRAEKILRAVYAPLKTQIVVTDIPSAELIKHASNSFLATKISFINAVSQVCDATGADVGEVARGMGLDPRIGSHFLRAGIGFGGFCFPKDLSAFLRMSGKLGVSFGILNEALKINEQQRKYFIQKIKKRFKNLKGKRFAVLGLAFKPNTDDIRFAPSLAIIRDLQRHGAVVSAYDPQAMPLAQKELRKVHFTDTPYEAVDGADALLLVTEWKEFIRLNYKRILKSMKQPIVFDGRNALNSASLISLGFEYYGIGRAVPAQRGE